MAISGPGDGPQGPFQPKLMSDINVTPMVDVMLVLLVIFMVTAPLLVAGTPVELPKNAAQPVPQSKKPVVVSLGADRSLSIRDARVDPNSLIPRLAEIRNSQGDSVIYVRADKKIAYGDVMDLLGWIGASGYQRISLLSQPPGNSEGSGSSPQGAAPNTVEPK